MPQLTIGDRSVTVGDDFLSLSPEKQQAVVEEIAGKIGPSEQFDRNDPRFQNMDTKAAFRGVPILGAFEPNAAAALSALAHPVTGAGSEGATFGERYAKNLPQEKAATKTFEEEHPVRDAVSQMVGGTLALGGAAGAAPTAARALGMTGRVLPAMRNAALSGSAIGGVDALARDTDPTTGAITGGLTGAGGVLAGKALGRGVEAVARNFRGEPPVPQRFIDVNGEQVPVPSSTVTRNPAEAAREQIIAKGAAGDEPQALATGLEQATREGMGRAHESFSAGLDPTGAAARTTPEAAAGTVGGDLVSQEAQRAADEVARSTRAAADLAGIRGGLGANPAPATPYDAGTAISGAVRGGATAAREARTAAYQAQAGLPGEFAPRHLLRAGEDVRGALNAPGEGRVRVSEGVTPNAMRALEIIDRDVAGLQFPNEAARGARPITPAEVEQVRKDLVQLRAAANRSARQNGNWEDARAVGRVMDEFDNFISRTAQRPGGFSGDAQAYLLGQQRARALHSNYRQAYSSQGPGDKVGRFIENVIGKYPGQELQPDAIAAKLIGSAREPGGGDTVAIAQRLRQMFGEGSPEWETIRKAALSHLTEDVGGALTHTEQADRILNFLNGTKGSMLAQTLFNPSERANLARYANQIRSVTDPAPASQAERLIARFSGRDGPASSSTDIVNHLFDLKANKEVSVQLARELRNRLAPESWSQVKQGMWSRLIEPPEGMLPWGSQKISQNISNFLKGDLANEMFTPNERMLMRTIANAHQQLIPVAGTNPSGTTPMAARLLKGASKQLLTLFGFAHGGIPGAAAAYTAGKAADWVAKKRTTAEAMKLFYGNQPRTISPRYQRSLALAASSTASLRDRSER